MRGVRIDIGFVVLSLAVLSIAVCSLSALASLPPPETEWDKTFGGGSYGIGRSVQQTSDGGYIVTGESYSGLWLIKTDSAGTKIWDKTFGRGSGDKGQSIQQTSDGGYIITGYTSSFGAGGSDVWLIKTDSAGNEQWNKTFGGTGNYDYGYSVQQTSDGGYIVTGTKTLSTGYPDVWLIKTNSAGNEQWNKTFGDGGYNSDAGLSVQQTSDGGYIVAGYSSGADAWLIKTDSAGNKIWDKTFGGWNWDYGYSVQQTSDGGYIVAGYTYSFGAGNSDVWLIKTDSSGTKIWDKTFGSANPEYGWSVQQTSDGGYIVAGYTWSNFYYYALLIKTDSAGNKVWGKTFGQEYTHNNFYSVQQTSDGGYILTGHREGFPSGFGVWLMKISNEPPKIDVAEELAPGSSIGGPASTEVTFTITVNNKGKTPLDVMLEDTIPGGLDYVSDTSGVPHTLDGNKYTWRLGMMNPSSSKSFFIVARIKEGASGSLINSVTARGTLSNGDKVIDVADINIAVYPTAKAGEDRSICAGGSVQIGGETAQPGYTYLWTPSTGLNSATSAQPTASPQETTEYTLTKTDSATGFYDTDSVVVTVSLTTANAGEDQSICTGGSVQIGGETAQPGYTYLWTPSTGLDDATSAQPTASPQEITEYTLTKTDSATGCSDTDSVMVTVNLNPTANAGDDQSICAGGSVQIGGETAQPGFIYLWTPSTGLDSATSAQPTASPQEITEYTLTKTDSATGCSDTDSVVVTVNPNPIATASSNSPVCIGGTISLIGGPDGMSSYLWTGPKGFSSSLPSPSISGATAFMTGTYTLRVESPDGCSNEASTEVVVSSPPLYPSQPSGPSSARRGSSYSFTTSTTDPDGDRVKYTFDWGDGTTTETDYVGSGTPVSRSHVWSRTGSFGVRAKATDDKGCDSGWSSSKMVSVTWLSPGNQSQADAELANGSEVQSLISIEDQAEIPPGQRSPDMSPPESTKVKPIAVYPG